MTAVCLGLFGVHRFEARFDLGAVDPGRIGKLEGFGIDAILDKLRTKTYVRDVCVKCGAVIERTKP